MTSMEPTTDSLEDILSKLLSAIPEVKAAAIVSAEGLPIASALPQGVDETRIAAMTARSAAPSPSMPAREAPRRWW